MKYLRKSKYGFWMDITANLYGDNGFGELIEIDLFAEDSAYYFWFGI